MYLSDVDHSLTFTIDTGHLSPFLITLRPWSQGLRPVSLDDIEPLPGDHHLARQFHHLWKTPLNDIQQQVTPEAWALWVSELPEGLLQKIKKLGLDDVGSLYLLANIPDMQEALAVPVFFRCLRHRWLNAVSYETFKDAMAYPRAVMSMPWGRRLGEMDEGMAMSRLMLKFLKCLPANYHIRAFGMGNGVLTDLSPYLPHFFNSRLRFGQRLDALEAFNYAAGFCRIDATIMQPLFRRVLKSGEKVRFHNTVMLLQRLKHTANALGKPSIEGVLQGAPSIRFLEKYLRRQERLLKYRLDNEIIHAQQKLPPEFPDAGLDRYPCIEPLLTTESIEQEGEYMSNCIASFKDSIREGEHAAFRLSWPVRCTVLIEKVDDEWALSDARTFHDACVKGDARKKLDEWLQGKPLEEANGMETPFMADSRRCVGYWELLHSTDAGEAWQEFEDQDDYDPLFEEDGEDLEGAEAPCLANENAMQVVDDEMSGIYNSSSWEKRDGASLPEKIGKWVRVRDIEQFHEAGFDEDMLTPAMKEALAFDNSSAAIYLHPSLLLRYALINDSKDPENSLELVQVPKPWIRPVDVTVLQRFDELRQFLRREEMLAFA